MTRNRRRFIRHVVVPIALTLPLVLAYASGDSVLMNLVASQRLGREFGLLEGAQALLLLACLATLVAGMLRARDRAARIILAGIAASTLFLLLEELDYGVTYYRWLAGAQRPDGWSLHRSLHTTGLFKSVMDVLVFVGFIVVPLALRRPRAAWLRFLRPSDWYVATVCTMFCLSKLAHHLIDPMDMRHALRGNVGEFRELVLYYLFLSYAWDLLVRVRGDGAAVAETGVHGQLFG